MKYLYIIIIGSILLNSCKDKKEAYVPLANKSSIHKAKVKEVFQGSIYTFLFVNENDQEYWMAANKTEAKTDDIIYYKNALKMVDFKSKELDRVFDEIFFVQNISNSPQLLSSSSKNSLHQHENGKNLTVSKIQISPAPNGMTIGELLEKGEVYSNKKVTIRGLVVKVNKNIMDRNWVHLKDGTGFNKENDLTFTTLLEVGVGDTITFEGVVAINKEYGAGYVYPLIIEDAVIK